MADPKLTIRIGAELSEIRRALSQVSGDIQNLRTQAQRPTSFGGLEDGARRAVAAVQALAASFVGIAGFQSFVRLADQAATLNARLRLATSSQEEFNAAYEGTFDIAQRTRTSLQATVDLYARLERSTRQLGINQGQLLALTETINQAAQLSGGGASAEAALFQFSQGLAAGTLRGEELNSVLEQAPRLAQALADGLNIPIGKLKEFAQQGKITSEQIVTALASQREALQREFSQLPLTISGSFTQLQNAIARFVGEADASSGASRQIAETISLLANNLDRLAAVLITGAKIVAAYFLLFRAGPAIMAAATAASDAFAAAQARVAAATTAAQTAMARFALALRIAAGILFAAFTGWQIGTLLREQFVEVELFGIAMVNGLLKAWERLKQGTAIAWEGIKALAIGAINVIREGIAGFVEGAATLPDIFGGAQAAARLRALADSIRPATSAADEFTAAVEGINAETERNIALIEAQTSEMADYAIEQRRAKEQAKTDPGPLSLAGNGGAAQAAANQGELVRDAIERAIRELDRLYQEAEVSARDYFAKKADLELAAIDSAIASAQAELAAADNASQQSEILTKIIKLQRDREEVATRAALGQANAERELADALDQVRTRLATAEGRGAEVRAAELEREFQTLRERLTAEGDQAGLDLVNRLVNVEVARSRLGDIEGVIRETTQRLAADEQSAEARIATGELSPGAAQQDLVASRQAAIDSLQTIRNELALLAQQEVPGAAEALAELDRTIGGIQEQNLTGFQRGLQNMRKELANLEANFAGNAIQSLEQGLGNALTDLATGAKSAGDAFRDMARAFVASIAQMAAEALAKKAILSLFGGGGVLAGVLHSGGMAGIGGTRRMVPAFAFAGAPRYHSGGMVGLKPGEVPAILQTGEEVLSRNDPRNARNGATAPAADASGVRIVNVLDPGMVSEALGSSSGERAIMNVITRNARGISQILR